METEFEGNNSWDSFSIEDYLRHLAYDCDTCLGNRELLDTCTAERTNTCTGETCTICEAKNPDNGCENNCNFEWKPTDGSTTTEQVTTTTSTTEQSTTTTEEPTTTTEEPITTTEEQTTTTEEPITTEGTTTLNPDDCSVMPVNWRGSKFTKTNKMYKGINSQNVQVTILKKNGADDLDQGLNIRKEAYIGYLIWSKKACGLDFLNAFEDGRLTLDFLDFGTYYDNSEAFMYKRDDAKFTSLTYQFFVSGGGMHLDATVDKGNKKRDQFIVNYHGISEVELINKLY